MCEGVFVTPGSAKHRRKLSVVSSSLWRPHVPDQRPWAEIKCGQSWLLLGGGRRGSRGRRMPRLFRCLVAQGVQEKATAPSPEMLQQIRQQEEQGAPVPPADRTRDQRWAPPGPRVYDSSFAPCTGVPGCPAPSYISELLPERREGDPGP